MKHAIGYQKDRVKRGKYEAFRNYYHNGKTENPDWEDLVKKKYATKQIDNENHIYFVSEGGIFLLQCLLDIKIIEKD